MYPRMGDRVTQGDTPKKGEPHLHRIGTENGETFREHGGSASRNGSEKTAWLLPLPRRFHRS